MKRILIIEDDQVIVEVEKDYLEASGYEVEIAISGEVGLKKALEEEYDLIILDLMLPNINGFEICRHVRQAKNIPILMVSAKREEIDKIRGLGLGADDYVTKPFSVGELVARVKAHLARYDRLMTDNFARQKDEITIRGIRIDKLSRKVFVNETEIPFTSKEFDLLLFLAIHPNQVFSKDELFEKIWGLDSIGDNATVTVFIGKLREKIETNPSKPQYIETIWGVGYRFNV
ncbi:DNA-binding response regulator, OmpR family, contains REC and winged-helix (wHTH) domain [Bacillus sp. OV166]|uniref:response regulator transcription factor n=1 Tax=unclassified Bacillus (in: firmicutes) TaxID=185979 RepID=UPI000A2AB1D0|nr:MULTISPECIES: response regulator transcription factor [unclassified Bacillus (in: firmicutes)]PGY16044.1 DNA-binding response regulator [Bacillus sp. AFS031507]SMQ64443.1 DNA-binding response regulator, OmpR family, contains REC and winged-helix (wHTH) domain [Bacillus sp. OV166]